ncbi:phage tail protein [Dickeya lacustris]|uniref:Phage tail protein n=1 Tax=Dickeya lacustris TaxID=2259638 RepID=A0ABY8G2N3_9GAMM|nr:phage tail protein [Dickeya lacustris]WFN54216.1 phage tail protein [Dickeya lacustris]
MAVKYMTVLTQVGAAKLASATALGSLMNITYMAVGDGGGSPTMPDPAQTSLVNEKRRAALNALRVDPANPNQIIAEQVIPENEGGFWLREIGLFDADGDLIAVANCPETYKPQLQEGSGRVQTVRMTLLVSNTDVVTLKIDPSVVLATRQYVEDNVIEAKTYADGQIAKHLIAGNPHPQYAPLASPVLTGAPTAPTPLTGTINNQLATTEFVKSNAVWLGRAIDAETNLNTLTGTRAARYWQPMSARALTSLNYPMTLAGSLDVEQNYANGAEGCVQRYTTYGYSNNIARVFTRTYDPGSNVWGPWQEQATVAFVQNALDSFVGIPMPWPQASAPAGWLKCNGQAFDKALYPKLAQIYPSGSLPDLRGEFIRGWDDGRGVDAGRAIMSAQGGMSFDHRHWLPTANGDGGDGAMTAVFIDGNSAMAYYPNGTNEYNPNPVTNTLLQTYTAKASRWDAMFGNETRPRNVAFNYIVRAA